ITPDLTMRYCPILILIYYIIHEMEMKKATYKGEHSKRLPEDFQVAFSNQPAPAEIASLSSKQGYNRSFVCE
uniref:hypothetical protein n=1 Tax=Eikenella halliae TaxID=1795832 RepID=UPI0028D4DB70